ncbi:MAG TPA: hypothetical protein VFI37_11275 [Gaiellaceae bacterium]|nr:hypothetical protein [Gaiellaceae bacterium]
MQNPFRTEPQAFRFLIATIVYFGLIVAAALAGGLWWGIAVFLVLTAAAAWWFFRAPDARRPQPVAPVRTTPAGELRILVVANETVGGAALLHEIRRRSESGVRQRVRVVAPALNSPLRQIASDEDGARSSAKERLEASLERLRAAGIDASGEVGDADPLQAIEDALRTFGADELIVSTHPEGRSHWLERSVVAEARRRFAVPVTHVVVDLAADRDEVR